MIEIGEYKTGRNSSACMKALLRKSGKSVEPQNPVWDWIPTPDMPVKAASAVAPFKGENFPQYVLYRPVRGSARHSIAAETISNDTENTQPLVVAQTQASTLLTTASRLHQDQPPQRKVRLASIGFRRPLPSPSLRPSLSEQLKTISQEAQAITAQLAITYKLPGRSNAPALVSSSSHGNADLAHDKLAFQATTMGLNVGKLECRFPCPVTFASDRCTYLFQHPFETKEILMIMYYRDMLHASINMGDHSFRFRLSRVLEQFGDDYNPKNTQHWIRIVLATASEAKKVKQFLASLDVTASSHTRISCHANK
ncbi:unnamed protein product [Phytophthora fragariaefolia]|uniref:Unnamed protein product n=1 Tax=Phytophthora fragariaefolia TaxID=1490495 RepID=A0A9W6XHU7_9STRA|nr:unnamed protein product [Phytophthora fragariaefolia]